MIIQLRGTSGSGKSHIVRAVLADVRNRTRHRQEGRRQPIGYSGQLGPLGGTSCASLGIPGHYETPCGGCDTIPDLTKVFAQVALAAEHHDHVLFEGLLASEDTRRTIELRDKLALMGGLGARSHELRVVLIDTPLEDCLAGIQKRRDDRGDVRPLNPANTTNRIRTIRRACDKLKEAGVYVATTDRAGAADLVRGWLHG